MIEMTRIVFMGTPEFSIPTLSGLVQSEYEIAAVYTQPDRPAGRSRGMACPPVKAFAQNVSLPVFQPQSLRNKYEVQQLANHAPDLLVVVAFGLILPSDVLKIPKFGCLNIHPSLLPRYRGPSPVTSAILAGDEETGVTIMLMNEGIDSGPILAQQSVTIDPQDTAGSLQDRLSTVGADLLLRTLPEWIEQKLVPVRQNNERASYTQTIRKQDGRLDWQLSAVELDRRVRAYYPWPGCHTYWRGKILKVLKAVPLPASKPVEPGLVVELSDDVASVGVGTSNGILGLLTIQFEGKRALAAQDFLRGQAQFIGQMLG